MESGSILIAEDDHATLELYTTAFTNAGLQVFTATTGSEAAAVALEKHPDIILIDIMMPDMDGHAAVDRIRADAWGKDAKVIYLTNFSDPTNVVGAVERGSDEYIVKSNTDVKEVVNKTRAAMYS